MMKRLLIITLIFLGASSVMAQDVVLLNYSSLERKLEKSNEDIKHERKGQKAKTWFKRGELMQDIYNIDLEYLREGTPKNEILIYYKEPKTTRTEEINGAAVEILEYDRIDYYIVNNALQRWVRNEILTEDPLMKAHEAFQKTLELDEKGRYEDRVKDQLQQLKAQFMQEGINAYYNGNSERALRDFEMVTKINDMELFEGVVDTIMIQYSGIIAREMGEYEKSAAYYEELIDVGFDKPNIYLNVKNDYLATEDTTKAIEVMERAFEKYPDTMNVVANLVDLYIVTDQSDKGLELINDVIENQPDEGTFYYWKGRILLNSGKENAIEGALESYQKSIDKDPSLYYVYFDIGYIYFLQGQDIFNQAGLEKDTERRKQINEIATEKYEQALPMLTKALEMNDQNNQIKRETLDVLKRIYYKLGMEEKYNEVTQQLNQMNQG